MSDWRPLIEALPIIDPNAAPQPSTLSDTTLEAPLNNISSASFASGSFATFGQTALPAPPSMTNVENHAGQAPLHDEKMTLLRAETEALTLRYRAAIDDLTQAREQVIKAAESDMVRLALTIAKEIVMSDIPARERFTTQMVEHALALLAQSATLTLRVSPQDLISLKQHKPELFSRSGMRVVEDDSLAAGGCIVDGAQGRVDATLTARLETMAEKLLGSEGGAL